MASARTSSYLSPETVQPHVGHLKLKAEEVKALTERQVLVRSMATRNSKELTGLGIVVADATPESFTDAFKALDYFKDQPSVLASGKFSSDPAISDLKNLTIDNKDIMALIKSKVGESDIKLSKAEIASIQAIVGPSRQPTPAIKAKVAEEFKKLIVERVKSYLSAGASAMVAYNDKEEPLNAHEAFVQLANEQASTSGHCAQFYQALSTFPQATPQDTESFVYWAKQKFGDMKPVINVVHVVIHRDGNRVLIASKQLYSSHYTDAGLTVAELIPFNDPQGNPRTLVAYSLRLQVDMLGGTFGFMKKRMAQPRILAALKDSLTGLRSNMETVTQAAISARAGK
ncbi:MAG TPA: hypothetical protein VNH22_04995 [Blastocatellia bacterium]|jgi:hypothetical protein|nr:hypothetical protein [Blastocatellia bacterium]